MQRNPRKENATSLTGRWMMKDDPSHSIEGKSELKEELGIQSKGDAVSAAKLGRARELGFWQEATSFWELLRKRKRDTWQLLV